MIIKYIVSWLLITTKYNLHIITSPPIVLGCDEFYFDMISVMYVFI